MSWDLIQTSAQCIFPLTRWGPVAYIGYHSTDCHLDKWLSTCLVPSHYLNQWWLNVIYTIGNKFQWSLIRNTNIPIQENAFENNVCENVVHFVSARCVKRKLSCIHPGSCFPRHHTAYDRVCYKRLVHLDFLVQDCSNSIANALELLQSCTKPSI